MSVQAELILVSATQVVTCRDVPRGRVGKAVGSTTVTDGAVAMDGDRLVFVGSTEECRRHVSLRPSGQELDCSGQVILPGLIDAHTHLPFAGDRAAEFRMRLAGRSYEEIAIDC